MVQQVKGSRKSSGNGRPVQESDPAGLADPIIVEEPIAEEEPAETEPVGEERAKLRSAASLRRRARTFERKPLEVVWVERENPSMVFIIVSLMLVVFAAVLLALALYLR